MKKFLARMIVAIPALCTLGLPAFAVEKVYVTGLTGAAEATPNDSAGIGVAIVTFDLDLLTMRLQTTFAQLTGDVTASHIHCCTASPGAATAGVATQLPTFSGFPLAATYGSYDAMFDMTAAASYNAAFVTANGGTPASAFSALLAGADAGKAYLNIHTSEVPSGEIRGFLAPVPEPETYALLLGGLAVVGWVRRRKPKMRPVAG